MNLILRPAAANDIEHAYDWYLERNRDSASRFLSAISRAFDQIEDNPKAYPILYRDVRRIRLNRFPYGLYYRLYSETIVIVACMHGRRDPNRWQSRE